LKNQNFSCKQLYAALEIIAALWSIKIIKFQLMASNKSCDYRN
jgi:hypothetical protein